MLGSVGQNGSPLCKKIDNYVFKFNELLGQGNFSKVYKGTHEITNETVAIKVIELNSLKSSKLEQLLFSEIDVLKKLNHPNILKCYQVFSSNRNCYIITEICNGGDLESKLRVNRHFSELEAEAYIIDVFKGLRYLSENHVVHRDLKVANIFIHNKMAKIADFGFSKFTYENFKDINIGSPIYMSPQGLISNVYGPKTDVWAFGIFIYELLHGKTPYSHCKTQTDLRRQIRIPISYSSLNNGISFDLKQVIISCLEINEEKRMTVKQLQNLNYFQKLLKKNGHGNGMHGVLQIGPKKVSSGLLSPTAKKSEIQHFSQEKNRIPIRSFHQGNQFSSNLQYNQSRNKIHENPSFFLSPTQNQSKKITFSPFHNSGNPRPYSAEKKNQFLESKPKLPEKNVKSTFLASPTKISSTDHNHNHNHNQLSSKNQKNISLEQFNTKGMKKSIMVSVLPGIINFKQSVNTLHYCRLFYKYISLSRELNIQERLRKYNKMNASWMFKILTEISQKIDKKEIVYDEETTKKETKLRDVTNQYYKKYSQTIDRPFEEEVSFDLIINQTKSRLQEFDGMQLYKSQMSNFLYVAFFLLMILQSTKILKKCSEELRFWEWSEYKEIEDFLSKSKSSLSYNLYLQLRRKVLK